MAIGPTSSLPVPPQPISDPAQPGALRERRPIEGQTDQSGPRRNPGVNQGRSAIAEPVDEDRFQFAAEQAAERARSAQPNLPRGSFLDITV